jgi:hypothetical protein
LGPDYGAEAVAVDDAIVFDWTAEANLHYFLPFMDFEVFLAASRADFSSLV